MRTLHSSLLALGTAVIAVLGVTACNNEGGTAPATSVLSQAQAESLATTVVADILGEIGTATMDGSNGAMATAPVDASAPAGSSTATQCIPAHSPTPVTDADNDGVPDSVRFDYTGCVISRPLSIDSLSGTINLIDPTKLVADHAVERVFTDFKRITVNLVSGAKSSVTDNGERMASHDGTTLRSTETNFRTDYVFANGVTAEHAPAEWHVVGERHVVVDAGTAVLLAYGDDKSAAPLQRELHRRAPLRCGQDHGRRGAE